MKYFSIETVVNAYKGFQDCMTNKSWGYLAILRGCKSSIRPSVPLEVDMDMVSNFLENIFNLSQTKKKYESGRSLYVVFSNKWNHYFNYQGKYSPNLFDIIVWAYRRKAFHDDITKEKLFQLFSEEFNIPIGGISDCFNVGPKEVLFVNTLYSESDLKAKLNQIGVNVSSNNIDAKKASYVASPGEISRGPFVQTLYAGLDITDYVLILQSDFYSLYGERKDISNNNNEDTKNLQQIFYGAPGTGKSHQIKDDADVKAADEKNLVFRTTFHPDSDYSTFVGCYKPTTSKSGIRGKQPILDYDSLVDKFKEYLNVPNVNITKACTLFGFDYHDSIIRIQENGRKVMDLVNDAYKSNTSYDSVVRGGMACYEQNPIHENDSKITYSFIPQAFLQAYVAAWNNPDDKVFLVIEEINRGNCAQIFGDLFQLLDRDDEGASEYPIMADKDLAKYLNGNDEEGRPVLTNKDGIKDDKLRLPKNLYIWATMNTSDQSLFPIDSAFKRRWDWVYMPIADAKKNYVIEIDNDQYDWWSFLEAINAIIESTTHSEDKKLGYFFAKAKDGRITVETFVSKVIFYLWNDVFKDNETNHKAFKDSDGELLAFRKFFHYDGTVDTNMVIKFLQDLEVFPFEHSDDGTTAVSDTTPNTKRQRDKSRYRVNGTDNLNKAQMTREAFRLYIEAHPDADAQTIAQAWNGLELKDYVQHLVETEAEFKARTKDSTDNNKRATEFELSNGEKIYLSTQFGIGNIGKFMDAVNNAGWNIRIENQA